MGSWYSKEANKRLRAIRHQAMALPPREVTVVPNTRRRIVQLRGGWNVEHAAGLRTILPDVVRQRGCTWGQTHSKQSEGCDDLARLPDAVRAQRRAPSWLVRLRRPRARKVLGLASVVRTARDSEFEGPGTTQRWC